MKARILAEENRKWWTLAAVSFALFMIMLDNTVVNVALPAIQRDLGIDVAQLEWVVTGYALSFAVLMLTGGKLADMLGRRRIFLFGLAVFTVSSLLCGLAGSAELLIGARVLQGVGAACMMPATLSIITATFPPKERGAALGIWAGVSAMALAIGPLVGGLITEHIGWNWIFYINVPVGLIAAAITWSIYRKRDPGSRKSPFDYVGLALLVLWIGALQIMIDKGKELDWFGSTQIVVLAIVAAVGFAFFLAWELTEEHPIVDLRLFARRNFLTGTMALAVAYGLFFGNVVLLPLWLQQYMGYTATWAGLATAPVGILAIIISPWVGKNVARIDPRKLASISFLGFGAVLVMRSHFNTQADFNTILVPTVLQGAAMAFFFIPLQAIIFSGLTPDRMPAAAGLSNFARITAGAIGTSIFTTVWENRAALHHSELAEGINNANSAATAAMSQLAASGYDASQSMAMINRMIDQQAYTLAVNDLFFLSGVLFVVLLAFVWAAQPAKNVAVDAGGAH